MTNLYQGYTNMKFAKCILCFVTVFLTIGSALTQETVSVAPDEPDQKNATTKPPLTGDPQKDYLFDPNLPYELRGFNLSDYPFYNSMPENITFKCDGLHDGFYASIPHKCQVYHQCLFGIRYDFLCANYTAFDQKNFICHFVSEIDCKNSEAYFDKNEALYIDPTTTTTTYRPPVRVKPALARRPSQGSGGRRRPARPVYYDYYDYYDGDDYAYYDDYETPTTTTTTTTSKPAPQRKNRLRKRFRGGPLRQRFVGEGRRRQYFGNSADFDSPNIHAMEPSQGDTTFDLDHLAPPQRSLSKEGDPKPFDRNDLFKMARLPPRISPPVPNPNSGKDSSDKSLPLWSVENPEEAVRPGHNKNNRKTLLKRVFPDDLSDPPEERQPSTGPPSSNIIDPLPVITDYDYYHYDDNDPQAPNPPSPPSVKELPKKSIPPRRFTEISPPKRLEPISLTEQRKSLFPDRKPLVTSRSTTTRTRTTTPEAAVSPPSTKNKSFKERGTAKQTSDSTSDDYEDYYYDYEEEPVAPNVSEQRSWSLGQPKRQAASQSESVPASKFNSFASRGRLQFRPEDDEFHVPARSQAKPGSYSRVVGQSPGQGREKPNLSRQYELLPQATGTHRLRSSSSRINWYSRTRDDYADY